MIVKIVQPPAPDLGPAITNYWAKSVFGAPVATNHASVSMVSTFMRLVESCVGEYTLAEGALQKFWQTHSHFDVASIHRAVSHFETCVSNMVRAIKCFNKLRRDKDVIREVRQNLSQQVLTFNKGATIKKLGDVRNLIHHFDTAAADELARGQSIALMATGSEVPVPNERGQTLKTIDRLEIGKHTLMFGDIAAWLNEMVACARIISEYEIHQPISPAAAFVRFFGP